MQPVRSKKFYGIASLCLMAIVEVMLAATLSPNSLMFPIVSLLFPTAIAIVAAIVLTLPDSDNVIEPGIQISQSASQLTQQTPAPKPKSNLSLEEQLAKLKARYEVLTTNIAAAVIIYDVNGHQTFCSPYTEVLTGHSLSDISNQSGDFLETLVIEEDLARYKRAKGVSEIGEDMLVRYRIRHRTGIPMWLETRIVPVFGEEDGSVVSIMTVTMDVTDSLNRQRQIEEQNRDLSDFAYMVSHDLKAPIFTIKGMTTALHEDYSKNLGEDGNELIDYIVSATERLERLVESVIEYSSISTKHLKAIDVDINDACESAIADFQEQIRVAGAVISVQEGLGKINGSSVRTYQIFSNLIGNALKYRSPDRTLTVNVSGHTTRDGTICIDIKDNGLGIPTDKLDEVFRPYRRVHTTKVEGSGIGLACVKKIVERMGGIVSVTSTEGKGSVFSIKLGHPTPEPQSIPPDLAKLYR